MLNEKRGIAGRKIEWPLNSPDRNSIENAWVRVISDLEWNYLKLSSSEPLQSELKEEIVAVIQQLGTASFGLL
jgi:hypothetical protein